MTRAASLGMYDTPYLHAANDALWAVVRRSLRHAGVAGVPETLDRTRPPQRVWSDPNLLLAQTCGYPLVTTLAGSVGLVATPVYDLPGCDGPLYCSFVIVRDDAALHDIADLRGTRCAMNGRDSNSGMNVLRAMVASLATDGRFFGNVIETGGHLASLQAVRAGTADVAAIDCVTHGLAARHAPALLVGTRVLARSVATPGLPFITALATPETDRAALRAALAAAIADGAGAPLGLAGLAMLTEDDYAPIAELEAAAAVAAYPMLA